MSVVQSTNEPLDHTQQILERLLSSLRERLGADVTALLLYDASVDEFDLPLGQGLKNPQALLDTAMRPRLHRVAAEIAHRQEPQFQINLQQSSSDYGPFCHSERVDSWCGVPMNNGGKVLGVVFVAHRTPRDFDEQGRNTITKTANSAAAAVAEADLLAELRERRSPASFEQARMLERISKLAYDIVHQPIALWLPDRDGPMLRIRAGTEVPSHYIGRVSARKGDDSLIGRLLETGEPQSALYNSDASLLLSPETTRPAEWRRRWVFLIQTWGRATGALEVCSQWEAELDQDVRSALSALADMAGIMLEKAFRSWGAERLARVARQLRVKTGFDQAMHTIVEGARELTGADSTVLFLFDPRSKRFAEGARSVDRRVFPLNLPRVHGLTRRIIDSGEVYVNNDTTKDPAAGRARGQDKARSLIGIRMDMGGEGIGVLYAQGKREDQFTEQQVALLGTLVNQASVAFGWSRVLLEAAGEIELAASGLYGLESVLADVCREVQDSLGFSYTAVQIIRPEDQVIETVYGTGLAAEWEKVAKHSLETEAGLRDIQADIALSRPPRLEIIAGWDARFDSWIYKEFDHQHYVRVWVPILLMRDCNGNVRDDWIQHWWDASKNIEDDKDRYRVIIEMPLPTSLDTENAGEIEVVGTVEAGFYIPERELPDLKGEITPARAVSLARLVARQALNIRRIMLPYVLERIVDQPGRVMGADSASLHFLFDEHQGEYVYQSCSGEHCKSFLARCPPRPGVGLGYDAIKSRRPKFIPDPFKSQRADALKTHNLSIWKEGIRAIAAFPLIVDDMTGVLYFHFRRSHQFTNDEIAWATLFAQRAEEAIRHAIGFTGIRDRVRALANLHSVAQSLARKPTSSSMLRRIAENAKNTLGGDIVIIFEYLQSERRFRLPPDVAGRLVESDTTDPVLEGYSAPERLVQEDPKPYYTPTDAMEDPVVNSPFVSRERIRSSAGIPLRLGKEIVGILFVHYRRPQSFPQEQRRMIETLASSAAIAIKHRRDLEILGEGREILTTLERERLWKLIVAHAVAVTGADMGLLLDRELTELARTSKEPIDPGGISIWVKEHRQTKLIADIESGSLDPTISPQSRAELSVPLLDGKGELLGILTVASKKARGFRQRHRRMLEALANQAVIGIQNADKQERLTAEETETALGFLVGQLAHRINNDVGAVEQFAELLMDDAPDSAQEILTNIASCSKNVLEDVRNLEL